MTGIESIGSTPVSTVIGDPVARLAADATVADAARALVDHGIGMIVLGDDATPSAVLTERDIVRVVASGRDPAGVPAAEVASTRL
jgi:CBS domain-containing protein